MVIKLIEYFLFNETLGKVVYSAKTKVNEKNDS